MVRNKTLIIVGAGASNECGMPTSQALKAEIADLLSIRFDYSDRQEAGDKLIYGALEHQVQKEVEFTRFRRHPKRLD